MTSNLLDAIIPTATYADMVTNSPSGSIKGVSYSGSNANAYLDNDAKDAGVALLNGTIAKYDGTYWKPLNDASKVLSGDFQVQVNSSDIGGVAGNGLIYTSTNAPFNTTYRLDTEFGVSSWSSATCNYANENMNSTNICAVRGMRLPTYSETQISSPHIYNPCGGTGSVNGVPSNGEWTWASTASTSSTNTYWKWRDTSYGTYGCNNKIRVRCVR